MLKLLFFVAITANVILIVSSGTASKRKEETYSSSSSNSSSSSSSSSSSTTDQKSSSESSSSTNESASASSHSSRTDSDDANSEGCSSDNDDDGDNDNNQKCGPNEEYSNCPYAVCRPKTCAQLGFPISCPAQAADHSCPGKPGCICKDGFIRNDEGDCISSSQCPSCGGDENARAGCGNCRKRCSDIGKEPRSCIAICYLNGCDCKENYVVDDNTGKCVLPEQCSPTCPKNEVYSNCTNGNTTNECCTKGCVCIDGYIRDNNGTCVPISEGETCGLNEEYSNCPDAVCRPMTCDQLGFPISCPAQAADGSCPGKPGCICREGFVRNNEGECISSSLCPSCGGDENARAGCGNCRKFCSDIGQEPKSCTAICYPNACDCKENYVVDDNTRKCVLPEQCSPTCPKNEVYSNCTNGNTTNDCCTKGCVCIDGYIRDNNGTCVPKSEGETCGLNEEYSNCPDAVCRPMTCDQLGFPISCPAQAADGSCPGKPGCICREGFVRNNEGECISSSLCPSCGGDVNAKAGCGVNCGRHCSDIGKGPVSCSAVCYFNACDCKENYVLDDNTGKCVFPDQCTPTCPTNEVFSDCTNGGCDARNCSQLGKPVPCVNIIKGGCITGCICIDGYLRADNGTCVPKSECLPVTPVCGKHEVYLDCVNGGCEAKNCSQLGKPIPCFKLNASSCIKGCICEEGYLRDSNGECIPKTQCHVCPTNEVFDECSYEGQCSPGTCDSIGKSYSCPAKIECKAQCRCKDGYYRNVLGQCISKEECTKCGQNQVYDLCPSTCPPQTCEGLGKKYACPARPITIDSCKPACRCLPGFFRNKIGECISEKNCLKCPGKHEYYSCGSACDNVCATLSKQNQTNCPIINITCNKKCYCEKGFARDSNNICIPIEKCPGNQPCKQCQQNEEYVECPDPCQVQKCSQLGYPVTCPEQPSNGKCQTKPACLCADGYLRNNKGVCIPRDKCPSCGGDPNARPGCGLNCGRLCSNYDKGPVACPRICKVNACDCKDEYVLDENTNRCVLPKNCSPTTTVAPTTTTPPKCNEGTTDETALDRFSEGNTDFTLNFLNQMIKKNPLASVVMSPFLVLIALAELTLYTDSGDSYDQLTNALNLKNKDEIRSVFSVLLNSLKAQQNVTLDLGAKIYVNENYQLTDNFQKDTKDIFDAEAENINFGDAEKAADIINSWVDEITRGLIKKLVSPDMFSAYTRLVLTNGIYFLGNWINQFDIDATKDEDFHVSNDKTIQVPMMFQKDSYKYTESSELDCKIVEIPYKGGNFSYVILVPNKIDGYRTLSEKIRDASTLNKALDALEFKTVYLYVPRHEIASTINLTEILKLLNITALFDDSKSNLSGILTNSEKLSVSDAIQKAIIKFDEKGTEAAAVTAIIVGTTSVGEPVTRYEVRADRPFIFILYQNRQPLFTGAYAGN